MRSCVESWESRDFISDRRAFLASFWEAWEDMLESCFRQWLIVQEAFDNGIEPL